MMRYSSLCSSYDYGNAEYWNTRYLEAGASFDWYQRYSALRPFVRKFVPSSSRILMVGCGNARTLDSLMCGTDAPFSASQMIYEVNRLLKPGGIFVLVTYGDPSVRVPHLNQPGCCWKITLYIIPRPDFKTAVGSSSLRSVMEPVPLTENGLLPPEYVLEDPESHYIYFCKKMEG